MVGDDPNYWMMVEKYPNMKEEVSGSILRCEISTGRSLHSQVEHHVRDKFATPILYGIDNF